jgi:predicted nucleotidyltransferase component of viral defense system
MSRDIVTNVAASTLAKLGNLAKATGRRHQDVVQTYALERWLARLAESPHADRFVLKGALMLLVWRLPATRPTRDIDLLARASNDLEVIAGMVADICRTTVPDDGVLFDAASVNTSRIAEDALYEGVRATFAATIGSSRLPMQIDLGFSDLITPGPERIAFPCLLGHPAPMLHAYNRETAIAEKFHAMVKLGELNSRMKDFFDIWALATTGTFDGANLSAAIQATFRQRQTTLDPHAVCLTEAFGNEARRQTQWNAFIRRSAIADAPAEFLIVMRDLRTMFLPLAEAVHQERPFAGQWPPRGPWQA